MMIIIIVVIVFVCGENPKFSFKKIKRQRRNEKIKKV